MISILEIPPGLRRFASSRPCHCQSSGTARLAAVTQVRDDAAALPYSDDGVMSGLVGLAIDQGFLDQDLHQTLAELLPEQVTDMPPHVTGITLEQVLANTAGFRPQPMPGRDYWTSPDWVARIIGDRAADGPAYYPPHEMPVGDGSFRWSSGGAHLLSAILASRGRTSSTPSASPPSRPSRRAHPVPERREPRPGPRTVRRRRLRLAHRPKASPMAPAG